MPHKDNSEFRKAIRNPGNGVPVPAMPTQGVPPRMNPGIDEQILPTDTAQGAGVGSVPGTDLATRAQNLAAREGLSPIPNPPGISVVSTTDWFGPLQPLRPAAPQGTEPRRMEYLLGQNLVFTPRANEAISYETLRALAESCDLVATAKETVKNQVKRMKWEIHSLARPGESNKSRTERELKDPVIKEISTLFKRPDGLHPWQTFVGEIFEDKLVVDAPAILPRRSAVEQGPNGLGKVKQLIAVDGTKITRYLTTAGLTPLPNPTCNDPAHALLGRSQAPAENGQVASCDCAAYTQYLYGTNSVNLTVNDLVFMPYNMRTNKMYGYSEIEQIVVAINLYLRRELSLLSYYTEGNIPEMIAFLPNSVTPKQVKDFEDWFNTVEQGRSDFKRRIRFLQNPSPTGQPTIHEAKTQLLADGIDEWLARIVAFAFNISPTALVRQVNRATAEQSSEDSEESGIEPYLEWFKQLMDYVIQVTMGYEDYEFTWAQRRETDLLKQRQADTLKVKSGGMTLNEWRVAEGQDPYEGIPDADKPIILTATGYVVVGAPQPAPALPGEKPEEPNDSDETKQKVEKRARPSISRANLTKESLTASARVERTLKTAFGAMRGKVLSSLRKSATPSLRKDDVAGWSEDQTKELLSTLGIDWESIVPELRQALEQAAQSGIIPTMQDLNLGDLNVFQTVNRNAADYARDRAAEMVGMSWGDDGSLVPNPDAEWAISDTTRDDIQQIITSAFEGNTNLDDVMSQIGSALQSSGNGVFSDARASLIARTEIGRAQTGAALDTWTQGGVKKIQWFCAGDDPCAECAVNDGVSVNLGEKFPGGQTSTLDSHPNCECGLFAVS